MRGSYGVLVWVLIVSLVISNALWSTYSANQTTVQSDGTVLQHRCVNIQGRAVSASMMGEPLVYCQEEATKNQQKAQQSR